MERLPKEIVLRILQYDKHFKVRKGTLVNTIPYDDPRRETLLLIPQKNVNGRVMLSDNDKYELHVMVVSTEKEVRWTMYKYFKNIYEEEVMDGVVFSMGR
jgi:hypothetical protein